MQVKQESNKPVSLFYAGREGAPTVDSLIRYFECNSETACELMDLAEWGFTHGVRGFYPDGDFSSDADFRYGAGAQIEMLQFKLDADNDSVFRIYVEAHTAGLTIYQAEAN